MLVELVTITDFGWGKAIVVQNSVSRNDVAYTSAVTPLFLFVEYTSLIFEDIIIRLPSSCRMLQPMFLAHTCPKPHYLP